MPTLAELYPAFGLRSPQIGSGLLNQAMLSSLGQRGNGSGLLGSGADQPPPTTTGGSGTTTGGGLSDLARAAAAISRIESGGRYDREGPTHPSLGRALGRYQVMEANIGPWALAAGLGRVTPDEFLRRPDLQDAIFRHRFGLYMNRYGSPERAAAAWFGGPGNIDNTRVADVFGTTVPDYVRRFMTGFY